MLPTLAPGQTYAPGVVYVPQPTYAPGIIPTYAPGKTYAPGMIPTPAPGKLFAPNMIPTPAPGQTYAPGMFPTLAPGMTYPANMIYNTPTPGATYAPGIVPTYAPGQTYAPGMIPTPAPGKLFAPNMIPTPAPGQTYAPGMIPTLAPGQTYAPGVIYNPYATPQPQQNLVPKTIPGCYVNGSLYQQGQRWLDGCDYTCMCDDAQAGHFSCQQRCPTFNSLPAGCTLQDSPSDPCCKTPTCPAGTTNVPVPSYGPGISGYGQAKQPTGSGTGTMGSGPSGSGQPSTFVNGNSGGTSGSRTGCLYNGKLYTQGQTWDDGCKARCTCEDAVAGRYQCTDRCPNYNNLPQQCRLVPDPNDACCQTYRCDFSTKTTLPPIYARTTPVAGGAYCLYKGQYYHQGEEWNDGCSSKCRCEDAVNHFYQCSESKFSNIPLGCTYVADPNDPQCCRIPQCTVTGSVGSGTSGTSSGQSPTGYTGSITGYGRPQPGTANFNPNITTTGYSKACIYKGTIYAQGQQWQDGCTYDCECLDASTGRYRCTDRCTKYANIPSNCQMVTDPNDQCCKKPVCTPVGPQTCADRLPDCSSYGSYACKAPYDGWAKDNCKKHCGYCGATGGTGIATGTGGGMTGTGTGQTGGTGTGSQGSFSGYGIVTQQPGTGFTGFSGGCFYKNQLYQQGQQWEDGCDYNCTCVNAQTGYYTCRALCATWTNLPQGCTLVKPPGECCSKPSCPGTGTGTGSGTSGTGTMTADILLRSYSL
ncbi:hypothetical protein KUTeg_018905 [Tegillarca granosa]|uniref:VWFC domain-containing protein n=1 Tax=Tegillarca granosa TaxID=220873 RepID=A0ABQ9EAZ3_TEGGR|nr:hypothetical protein KUTeg_018905 [Tegillarca granosa]